VPLWRLLLGGRKLHHVDAFADFCEKGGGEYAALPTISRDLWEQAGDFLTEFSGSDLGGFSEDDGWHTTICEFVEHSKAPK